MNQVKIAEIYDETSRLSENKDGILFQYGIDERRVPPPMLKYQKARGTTLFPCLSLAIDWTKILPKKKPGR